MSYHTVRFEKRRVKYRDGCKTVLDIVDEAYQSIDAELKTNFGSRDEQPKREGFLYTTADIFLRCLDIDFRDKWRVFNLKVLHLDPEAYTIYKTIENDVLNMTLIRHFNAASPVKGLSEASTSISQKDISDRFVLMHEIFCRLFAVALSNQALVSESHEENGQQILKILRKVVELLGASQVTLRKSFLQVAKNLWHNGQTEVATEFTEMLRTIADDIQAASVVIESISTLKLNQKALRNALAYLKESDKVLRSLIIGEKCFCQNLSLSSADLRPRMLQTTYRIKMHEYNASIESEKRGNFFVSDITQALAILLDDTETLSKLFAHIAVAADVGGWTFWLMNVVNIEELVKEISKHYARICDVGDRMTKELPGIATSAPGIAIGTNSAWPTSVKLGQTNVATCQQFTLLNDPSIRAQLLARNASAITDLVSIHNTSKFQFINIKMAYDILGGTMIIKDHENDAPFENKRVDLSAQEICREIATNTLKDAARLHHKSLHGVTIQNYDDGRFIEQFKAYLQAGFSTYREIQVKQSEYNYFALQLRDRLVSKLFSLGSGVKTLMIDVDSFTSHMILSCIVFSLADLLKVRDAQGLLETKSPETPPPCPVYQSTLPNGALIEFVESRPQSEMGRSSIRLMDPALAFSDKNVAQSVLNQLDTTSDRARNLAIVNVMGAEIFQLLQAEPSNPIIGKLSVIAPEIAGTVEKYRCEIEQSSQVKEKELEKHHGKLRLLSQSILHQCQNHTLVYEFIRLELGPKKHLTLGLLSAWAMIHNLCLNIYEYDPDSEQLKQILATGDSDNPRQLYLLKKSIHSFSILLKKIPGQEYSPTRVDNKGAALDFWGNRTGGRMSPTSNPQQEQALSDTVRSSRFSSATQRSKRYPSRSPRSPSPRSCVSSPTSDSSQYDDSPRIAFFSSSPSQSPEVSRVRWKSLSPRPLTSLTRSSGGSDRGQRGRLTRNHQTSGSPPEIPTLNLAVDQSTTHARRASVPNVSPRTPLYADGRTRPSLSSSADDRSSETKNYGGGRGYSTVR